VLRGGAGEQAGLAAGDEILALRGWRIRRLDDAVRLLDGDAEAPLLVARDQRVLTLPLALPSAEASTAGAVALKPAPKPAADAQRALQGMARRLSDLRWVLPSPRRRVQFAALVLVVIAMHGCVTRNLAERMASFASAARMPPRIEVAYVRSLEPERRPRSHRPRRRHRLRRAARSAGAPAASAPVVTAEAKAGARTPASPMTGRAERRGGSAPCRGRRGRRPRSAPTPAAAASRTGAGARAPRAASASRIGSPRAPASAAPPSPALRAASRSTGPRRRA
jgi:hypothetical protein